MEEVIFYKTTDGRTFENKQEADWRESILSNPDRKICDKCDGKKQVNATEYWHLSENWENCGKCHGKGYLEKTIVWA